MNEAEMMEASSVSYTPPETPKENEQLKRNLASEIVKKEREVQEEQLLTDKNWADSSRLVYEIENSVAFEGDDAEASKMGLDLMSHINYNLSLGTVPFATKMATAELTDTQKIATRYMMETYDAKDISFDGAMRFGKEIGQDVTTYLGIGTLGWGFAAKTGAKEVAKRGIMEATKLNIGKFAKSAYGAAALEGAVYSAVDDAAFQNIKMATEAQEEYSPGQTALASTIGAVAAPVAMKGLTYGGQQITKGGKYLRDAMQEFQDAQPFSYAPDGTPLWDNPGGGLPPQAKPQFYSQLSEALTGTNQKTWNKDQLQGFLAKQGVKTEEMKWSGIQDYLDNLDGRAKVNTQDLLDELNPPQLEKTTLGGSEAVNENSTYLSNNAVKKAFEIAPDREDFELTLVNDGDAYQKFHGMFGDDKDWDDVVSLIADDIYKSEDGATKYRDYIVKDIDGTNYREELTTLGEGAIKNERELNSLYSKISNDPIKYNRDTDVYKQYEAKMEETVLSHPDYKDVKITDGGDGYWYAEKAPYDGKGDVGESGRSKMGLLNSMYNKIKGKSDSYKSSHWDELNVLYHARKQDIDIDGDKTLLIEEIQSDWHQEGRKKGYLDKDNQKDTADIETYFSLKGVRGKAEERKQITQTLKEKYPEWKQQYSNFEDFLKNHKANLERHTWDKKTSSVPQAPYSKTWHEKAMKDQIAEAVEEGYDRVAWVAGKEQAERYDLSKQIDTLEYHKDKTGKYHIDAYKDNYNTINKKGLSEDELADFIGKDVADKIIKGEKTDVADSGKNVLSGVDLEVGGEGMKGFYDKMLPKWTNKYIKKFGSKVEVKELPNGQEVWSFPVTDKMKTDVQGKGQSLYSMGAGAGAMGATQQEDDN